MKYPDIRTNSATANVVNQGIAWRETYGARSAAAFLAHRDIPRPVIERVIKGEEIRGTTTPRHQERAAAGPNS